MITRLLGVLLLAVATAVGAGAWSIYASCQSTVVMNCPADTQVGGLIFSLIAVALGFNALALIILGRLPQKKIGRKQ